MTVEEAREILKTTRVYKSLPFHDVICEPIAISSQQVVTTYDFLSQEMVTVNVFTAGVRTHKLVFALDEWLGLKEVQA